MLTIWGRANSVNVQKVLWCCAELDIKYERIDAGRGFQDTNTEEYRKLNPNKLVPTIVDGDFVLWESNVIVRYLAASYGDDVFYPKNLRALFASEQWMDWNATTMWPAIRPIFLMLVRTTPDQRDMNSVGTLQVRAEATLKVLDEHLRDRRFIGGDELTIADIPAGVSAHRWFNLEIERPDFLHVQRWFKELEQRPAFRAQVMRPLT